MDKLPALPKKVLVFFLFLLWGCEKKPDFKKIRMGMTSTEVLRLVGTPYRKQPMAGAMWWLYSDSAKHIVVIDHDTVANCSTQTEAIDILTRALKSIDSLRPN